MAIKDSMQQVVSINQLLANANKHISQVMQAALQAQMALVASGNALTESFASSNTNTDIWQLSNKANNVGTKNVIELDAINIYRIDAAADALHATTKYKASWSQPEQAINADVQLAAQAVFCASILSAKAVNLLGQQTGVKQGGGVTAQQYMAADSSRKKDCYALAITRKLIKAANQNIAANQQAMEGLQQTDAKLFNAIMQSKNFATNAIASMNKANANLGNALEICKNSGLLNNQQSNTPNLQVVPSGLINADVGSVSTCLVNAGKAKNEQNIKK